MLTQISQDVEEVNHLILKIWAIFDFEINKPLVDQDNISHRIKPLRDKLFEDFNLLSKNEGLLLLYGYKTQQLQLRRYGEFLGKFTSYIAFKSEIPTAIDSRKYREDILKLRSDFYESLNKILTSSKI